MGRSCPCLSLELFCVDFLYLLKKNISLRTVRACFSLSVRSPVLWSWCRSVVKYCLTLQPHGLQHTRLPCPSLSPRVCSGSCPLSCWCYLTISYSAAFFSFFYLQSFSELGSFPLSQLFASGGPSIRISF